MARKPRIVLPDVVHHVVSRGANKTLLFTSRSEKERYLRRFSLIAAEEKVLVQGYCIMDNHVHWLLTPTSAFNFSNSRKASGVKSNWILYLSAVLPI